MCIFFEHRLMGYFKLNILFVQSCFVLHQEACTVQYDFVLQKKYGLEKDVKKSMRGEKTKKINNQ